MTARTTKWVNIIILLFDTFLHFQHYDGRVSSSAAEYETPWKFWGKIIMFHFLRCVTWYQRTSFSTFSGDKKFSIHYIDTTVTFQNMCNFTHHEAKYLIFWLLSCRTPTAINWHCLVFGKTEPSPLFSSFPALKKQEGSDSRHEKVRRRAIITYDEESYRHPCSSKYQRPLPGHFIVTWLLS